MSPFNTRTYAQVIIQHKLDKKLKEFNPMSQVIIQQYVDVHLQNCKLCNSVWLFCVDRQINRWII